MSIDKMDRETKNAFLADVLQSLQASEKAQAEAEGKAEGPDLAATLNIPFALNGKPIPPLTLQSLAALEYMRNPLASDDTDGYTVLDVWEFLYIVCRSESEIADIYQFATAKRALDDTRQIADKGPEFYSQYLAALERLTDRHFPQWTARIEAFAKEFGNVPTAELMATVEMVLSQATPEAKQQQKAEGQEDKKKARTEESGYCRLLTFWRRNTDGKKPI